MPVIGVRELREHTAEVLRQVREQRAEYVITNQGKPVAFLSPVDEDAVEAAMVRASRASVDDRWKAYLRFVDEVRNNPLREYATQGAIDQIRR